MSSPTPREWVQSSNAVAPNEVRMSGPKLFGILNITEDSFSDGGRNLDPAVALAAARQLAADGADVVDIGAAASNIAAKPVSPDEEIRRLTPVIAALKKAGIATSIDSFALETQRYALSAGVDFLNDIEGFPEPALYPALAAADCRLVVMHAVHGRGRAQAIDVSAIDIWQRIEAFFAARVATLEAAGVARERLILDPGMGFFLGSDAAASLHVLANLDRLKRAFALPVLVSVSRKSFLGAVSARPDPMSRGAATLAAELYAAAKGADFIRTHNPGALRDGLLVMAALARESGSIG
jgi:dihydropteroate synthase type 2